MACRLVSITVPCPPRPFPVPPTSHAHGPHIAANTRISLPERPPSLPLLPAGPARCASAPSLQRPLGTLPSSWSASSESPHLLHALEARCPPALLLLRLCMVQASEYDCLMATRLRGNPLWESVLPNSSHFISVRIRQHSGRLFAVATFHFCQCESERATAKWGGERRPACCTSR